MIETLTMTGKVTRMAFMGIERAAISAKENTLVAARIKKATTTALKWVKMRRKMTAKAIPEKRRKRRSSF